jgi:hypothetical protein
MGRIIAPFIGEVVGADSLEEALALAVGQLFQRAELADDLEYASVVMGAQTQVAFTSAKGEALTRTLDATFLDGHFRGRLDEWLEWLVFALRVNCGSFFNGSSQLGEKIRANAKKRAATTELPSQSQPTVATTG